MMNKKKCTEILSLNKIQHKICSSTVDTLSSRVVQTLFNNYYNYIQFDLDIWTCHLFVFLILKGKLRIYIFSMMV